MHAIELESELELELDTVSIYIMWKIWSCRVMALCVHMLYWMSSRKPIKISTKYNNNNQHEASEANAETMAPML